MRNDALSPMPLPLVPTPVPLRGPVFFISDLHLGADTPGTEAAFAGFLDSIAATAGGLFILGDFFEYWVGDDAADMDGAHGRIARCLRALAARGVAIWFMPGNRDFLVGRSFARSAGMTLLPDPCVLEAFGQRIVLAHGDALCTDDLAYMRFRRIVRSRLVQCLFLALPTRVRRGIAQRMRMQSQRSQAMQAPGQWADIAPQAEQALFARSDSRLMIHGHTHHPASHASPGGTRHVLPDWDFDGGGPERGHALRLDATGALTRHPVAGNSVTGDTGSSRA